MKIILPKENIDYNPENSNYSNLQITLGSIDNYRICQRMGRGKYSEVFQGICLVNSEINVKNEYLIDKIKSNQNKNQENECLIDKIKSNYNKNQENEDLSDKTKLHYKKNIENEDLSNKIKLHHKKIVIKALKPIRIEKVIREIMVLKTLNHKNIISLVDVVHDKSSETYSLIFNYIKHKDTNVIFQNASLNSIKMFAKQILEGLEYAHSKGIFHRDIKPQNIIITDSRQLKIIDWGLGEFYRPNQSYSVRVASRYYKSPELLLEYPFYDYSLDIWSFGCILAQLIFKNSPFFQGTSNSDQLCKIINFLGKKDLKEYLKKFDIKFDIPNCVQEERIPFKSLLNDIQYIIFKDAIDLLDKILIYDHSERLTASQCLLYPFFTV